MWLKLDVDTHDPAHIASLDAFIASAKITVGIIIRTRGGYHYALLKDTVVGDGLHKFTKANEAWVTINRGSPVLAVPGTFQGGYVPRIVYPDAKP